MKKLIYSIYIDIPEHLLDETGYSVHARTNKHRGERAGETKDKLAAYKNKLMWQQKLYADTVDADYKLYHFDKEFVDYYRYCKKVYDNLPMYHIINYYKHHLMLKNSYTYDAVYYIDIDVIPQTECDVFEEHDLKYFYAMNNNDLAEWGKKHDLTRYNSCDRNPVIKYWNAYALLLEHGLDPENNVINTGTMLGGSHAIQKLAWDDYFEYCVEVMRELQTDKKSMFPQALQERFAFDNESMFSFLINFLNVPYKTFEDEWHHRLPDTGPDKDAKMIHAISKKFELIWPNVEYEGRAL